MKPLEQITRQAFLIFKRIPIFIACFYLLGAMSAANIQISGVKKSIRENIEQRLLSLQEHQSLDEFSATYLQQQVKEALYPYGYFKPTIKLLSINKKNIRLSIQPGPPLPVTSIKLSIIGEGKEEANVLEAARSFPLQQGDTLNTALYEKGKDQLLSAAEHDGYLRAAFNTAEILVDRKSYTAHITLVFNTGPAYYFGQVRFDPTYISPALLRRFLPYKIGEPYSTDKLLALENSLSNSGYFKSVVVKPNLSAGYQQVPVRVHLEAADRIHYAIGAGYGTDTGPRGRASVQISPVNRAGHQFNAIAQGSFNENALLAQYTIPGHNPITDKYSLTGSLSNLNYNSGYANSLLLSLAQQHITNHFQRTLSLNALTERFNYTNEPKTTQSLLFPKATLAWRHVSDPLFSPSGYKLTISGFAASKALLSQLNLAQANVDAKAAITLETIRTRFFAHAIQGITAVNDIDNVPLSLALLLGGADNLKGYNYNAIGPGKIISYAGLEIQKETKSKWYIIGFTDVGDVYNPIPKNYKYDVGAGLMWVSPVGPIKVALAQPVDSHFNRLSGQGPKLVINMGPDL